MSTIKLVHSDTLSCEAIFRIAPDGHYIIVSQCGGDKEPDIKNRVYIFHSYDQGKTWSEPQLIIKDNGLAQYQTEVSIIRNKILVFMTEHDGNFCNFHSYVIASEDSGSTFHKVFDFNLKPGFCFVRGMIEKDGFYYFPYQHYNVDKQTNKYLHANNLKIWDCTLKCVENGIIKTNDFKNFIVCEKPAMLPLTYKGKKKWVWSEPTIAFIKNKLIMLLRNDARGYLYVSYSRNFGKTFSKPRKTNIPNPANKPKLIQNGEYLVLLNTPQSENGYSHRNPLSCWIMTKKIKNCIFKEDVVKETGWISYPDGVIVNKKLLFAYEYNRKEVYFVEHDLSKILK